MIALRPHEPGAAPLLEPWVAPLLHRPLSRGERACCCPARAAFAVVVAPSASLPHPPDVLLCGHHTRAARARLAGEGIAVYDAMGTLVTPDAAALVGADDLAVAAPC